MMQAPWETWERRGQPLLPMSAFLRRLFAQALIAFVIIGGSLAVGIFGYHLAGGFGWLDSLYNASMILGGMGPVSGDLKGTPNALKWFASFYALYSGLALLTSAGVFLAPVVHRLLHRFHLDATPDAD